MNNSSPPLDPLPSDPRSGPAGGPGRSAAAARRIPPFQLASVVALGLAGLALGLGSKLAAGLVAGGWFLLMGLGIACPRLSWFGPFLCRGRAGLKWVALTFDDGPDARSTPALLDLLREHGVQATFFCVGRRVAEEPALAARMVREGHLLGNHSYHHSNVTNFFTLPRLREELSRTQQAITEATGTAPRWFRPPMGLSNPRVFQAAHSLGLSVIGWTARGLDTVTANPERIVARIRRGLQPGAIILLHDGNIPPERLLVTVKLLLDTLRTGGYQVVRLDRILT